MSELCLSSTSKTQLFFTLLKSDFFLFCSLVLSNPLYFLYFIFFSPYLLKLLSFLSPLFITTSLLLLVFLTVSPCLIEEEFSKESSACGKKVSFLIAAYHAVVEKLRSKIDDDQNEELLCLEDFEVYKIVFDTPLIHDSGGSPDPSTSLEAPVLACSSEGFESSLEVENSRNSGAELQGKWAVQMEKKRLDFFLEQLDEFERSAMVSTGVEEKKIHTPVAKPNKAVEKEQEEEESQERNGSEAAGNRKSQNTAEFGSGKERQVTTRVKAHSQRVVGANFNNEDNAFKIESSRRLDHMNLGSYGSMRKEKDWKRTLACKLFEERHNADGGEGMDLLWETYENESSKTKPKTELNKKKKNKAKYEVKYHIDEEEEEDGDEGDGEDESDGQLCCLQALKFSTGKMNLGMGRPNLVKISKAIKGFGWLHHVSSRHSKKVHNGDRF